MGFLKVPKLARFLKMRDLGGGSKIPFVKLHQKTHHLIVLEKYDERWKLEPCISIDNKMALFDVLAYLLGKSTRHWERSERCRGLQPL